MISMMQILKTAIREKASDIHITSNVPPVLRVGGQLIQLNVEVLTSKQCKELCYSTITDEQKGIFETKKDLDFSFAIGEHSRFRAHLFYQKESVAGVFRQIPVAVPDIKDIGVPPIVMELTKKPYGLVLVAGATGSGKSTTLAAMINEINKTKKCHIVTMEDPIEFVYPHEQGIVNQREVGKDVKDFDESMKAVLRMDPDVCLLGEMRDKSTIATALKIAETGHLTFGTIHTNTSYHGIERLTGVFSDVERLLIQNQLSMVLQGIICQKLLPTADGKGRVPAIEVLLFPQSIRHLVKEGKVGQIYSLMQTNKAMGMITMNQSLCELCMKRIITEQVALLASADKQELINLLQRSGYKKARSA